MQLCNCIRTYVPAILHQFGQHRPSAVSVSESPPRLLKLVLQPFEGRRIGFAVRNDQIGRDSQNPF